MAWRRELVELGLTLEQARAALKTARATHRGPGHVIDSVTCARAGEVGQGEPCVTCGQPIGQPDGYSFMRSTGPAWVHLGTQRYMGPGPDATHPQLDSHGAAFEPRCPDCGARGEAWQVRDTAWGIQSDCAACGYTHYFSLGD